MAARFCYMVNGFESSEFRQLSRFCYGEFRFYFQESLCLHSHTLNILKQLISPVILPVTRIDRLKNFAAFAVRTGRNAQPAPWAESGQKKPRGEGAAGIKNRCQWQAHPSETYPRP